MKFVNPLLYLLMLSLMGISGPAHSQSVTVFTSFEFNDSGTFSIGEAPLTATFSGGAAQVIGVGAYYHTGTHSWHVPDGGMSTVTFETAVESVDFWFRDTMGASTSNYRIIDTENAVIVSGSGTQSFVNVELSRSGNQSRIAKVEFDSVGGGDTVVDDFSFTTSAEPAQVGLTVVLEEPVDGVVHGGIGNLRGWAISPDGIDRVEILIDGTFAFEAPYGGTRTDVGDQFPEIDDSQLSGFSLAYGYSNLSTGEHTITARAFTTLGEQLESKAVFTVVAFDKTFIPSNDIVDATDSTLAAQGDEITVNNVSIDGRLYDLRLKWRTAEQGFEIIEIR